MHKSVLKISKKDSKCLGTGFVIDKDDNGIFVATCGHVINNSEKEVLVENKPAKVILNKYENGLDLAVLYVEGLDIEPLPISDSKSVNNVQVIGFSMLNSIPKREPINDIEIKHGITFSTPVEISAIKLYPKESISSGYSGSPVICQNSNKVIGIVNIQVGNDTNYAIDAKHLLDIYSLKNGSQKHMALKVKTGFISKLNKDQISNISKELESVFNNSLKTYSTQPKIWIEPRLHSKEEDSHSSTDNDTKIDIKNIISSPQSLIIQARQQFGLTCLSHYLIREAWSCQKPFFWLYIDSNKLKPHTREIEKYISNKIKNTGLLIADIDCVILDEFSTSLKNASKILNKVSDFFTNTPIIIMMSLIENPLLNESITSPQNREFNKLYLWALPRQDVRKVVSNYNAEKYIGDENAIVNKITSDLDVLNIPRTALNCLTILKIYEVEFDDSPVNRIEMIRRVLFLLFNVDEIPHYKTRPDLKDTEFILGYLCELMLKERSYFFTRESFLKTLHDFCQKSEIDLDIHVIFDILYTNNIIVMREQYFCFKFSYWVFYFAAHRMHHNQYFADYILQDMNYSSYPELIEFYTGIDRRRDDALKILTRDIRTTKALVEKKCGLPDEFNIYNLAQWNPSYSTIKAMHNEVSSGVLESNLPDTIKDKYADQSYDRTRPLTQSIHTILEDYSLLRLMKTIDAGSKALRNSDYSDPVIRHELLEEILQGWNQLIKVLIVLAPILSEKGYATVEGASFILTDDFKGSTEEKFNEIIRTIPTNVVAWYKDDLFSKKWVLYCINT